MTLEKDMTVKLSIRDWVAIGALAAGILGSVMTAWLHHDRMLVQIVTQQGAANARLDKIEARLERNSR